MLALTSIPYQRSWADELQYIQLKREVAGTSRIEGAEFTERELEAALSETPEQLETRSQRQAAAAVATYRWIAQLPNDHPINETLIQEVHRRLISGCDDDHCPPAQLRNRDQNVTFGAPRHRGVEGGDQCFEALRQLLEAVRTTYHLGLKGIEIQCKRLFGEIRRNVAKALYRNTVTDLFGRLKSPRKRVMSARHVQCSIRFSMRTASRRRSS